MLFSRRLQTALKTSAGPFPRLSPHIRCANGRRNPCRNFLTMCAAPKEESPQQDSPEAKQQQPAHVEDDLSLEGFDGLTPEEDEQVPGNYADAMNPNSKLGKAVKAACAELEELNDLELEILNQAQDALKRLGVKGASIDALARPPQTKDKRVGLDETVEDEQTQQASSQGGEDSK